MAAKTAKKQPIHTVRSRKAALDRRAKRRAALRGRAQLAAIEETQDAAVLADLEREEAARDRDWAMRPRLWPSRCAVDVQTGKLIGPPPAAKPYVELFR